MPWLGSDPVCLPLQMEVQSPPGTTIGHVLQTWHPFFPKFSIQDADRHTVLRVVGPCCTCGCGTDTNFEVSGVRRDSWDLHKPRWQLPWGRMAYTKVKTQVHQSKSTGTSTTFPVFLSIQKQDGSVVL